MSTQTPAPRAAELDWPALPTLDHLTGAPDAVRLGDDHPAIIEALPGVGRLRVCAVNRAARIERRGPAGKSTVHRSPMHTMGTVLDGPVDLRLFMSRWGAAYAVPELRTIAFFHKDGTPVLEVGLDDGEDTAAFDALVAQHTADDQSPYTPEPPAEKKEDRPDAEIDTDGLLAAWDELKDTHDFIHLLRKFGVGRTQSLRLAEGRFTRSAPPASLQTLLERAASEQLKVLIFLGNPGAFQIHLGHIDAPTASTDDAGPLLQVGTSDGDPLALSIRPERLARAWTVRKPSGGTQRNSLELFDADDNLVLIVHEKRAEGDPETDAWLRLIDDIGHAFPAETATRVIDHMNDDHRDAMVAIARVQGGRAWTEDAEMTAIDSKGMDLKLHAAGRDSESLRVPFDPPLPHPGACREVLVAMTKAARAQLGEG